MFPLPSDLLECLLRRLGLKRSASPLVPGQEVWLFDNTAFRTARSRWSAEFVAAYFTRDSGRNVSRFVAEVADILGIVDDEEKERRIAERIQPFLNTILGRKVVDVGFGAGRASGERIRLGPAEDKGISVNEISLPGKGWCGGDVVESTAVLPEEGGQWSRMRTIFAAEDGWGVISDIDDTIKVSHVRSRISLLAHTFIEDPTPVDGMPQLYSTLENALKPIWFYLSASPYNLYPMLRSFTNEHYPPGQLILRHMSWMELESFIVSLTVGTQAYKEERIATVMRWLPKRKWVLVGDSTQTDPEAYAAAYKLNPAPIKAIFIRVVTGVNEEVERELNSAERFSKAFKDVPRGIWKTFHSPEELVEAVEALRSV